MTLTERADDLAWLSEQSEQDGTLARDGPMPRWSRRALKFGGLLVFDVLSLKKGRGP
jgi:hypothetical protein